MKEEHNISEIKNFVKYLTFEKVKEKCKKIPYCFNVTELDNLYMVSFTDQSNLSLSISRKMNGVIFEKETNKLLHYSFQKSYDGIFSLYEENEKDSFKKKLPKKYSIEISIEGTHIKLFWYNNKWNVATSRNIDASMSFWNNDKSFKELFYEVCCYENINFEDLDTNCCYSFIMQHPENFITNVISVPYCDILNKINLHTGEIFKMTKGLEVFSSIEKIIKTAKLDKTNFNYLVYLEDGSRIKILNQKTKNLKKILKNNTSLEKSYLQSISDGNSFILREILKKEKDTFDKIDNILDYTILKIHESYKNFYIYKKDDDIYFKFQKILKQLHNNYIKTGKKINYSDVFNIILDKNMNNITWLLDI